MNREELKAALEEAVTNDVGDEYKQRIVDAVWVVVDAREVEWQQRLDLATAGAETVPKANAPDWLDDGSFGRPVETDPSDLRIHPAE